MYKVLLFSTGILVGIFSNAYSQNVSDDFGNLASFTEIHAYIATDFSMKQGGYSEFDPHEIYINVSSRISKNIRAVGEFEIEHGGQLLKMTKLFSEWNIDKRFNLKFGLDFTPFSIQDKTYYSPLRLRKFSSHPISTREILPAAWRETGAYIFGTFGNEKKIHLKYDLSVFNGLGSEAFTNVRASEHYLDNNSNKMVAGRVSINYSKNMQLGGSYSIGKYDDEQQFDLKMFATHLLFTKDHFDLIAEYISSQTTDTVRTKLRNGGHLTLGYRIFEDALINNVNYFEPILRFQMMDTDESVQDESDFLGYAFGFNYSPAEHYKFVFEYEFIQERYGQQVANNALTLEMVIDF